MMPKTGITFSHSHLEYLGLDVSKSLETAFTFGFSHIRLGAYWNRIEREAGIFDFTELHALLTSCEKVLQPVVLTVGMKAPRWPEFYFPSFVPKDPGNRTTREKTLIFIKKTVEEAKKYHCITHFQVENEPLDPGGSENQSISRNFLEEEIALVRSLDKRPLVVNLWGNDLVSRGLFPAAQELADIVGIDLYYRQFLSHILGKSFYTRPRQEKTLEKVIRQARKPVWLTELQAEPWEKDNKGYLSENPGSMSPEKLRANLVEASGLNVGEILLWGFEYWLYRASKGDTRYLHAVRRLMERA